MGLSNSQYESIMRSYQQRQLLEKRLLDERTEEIYRKLPAVKELNAEIGSSALRSAKALLEGDSGAVEKLRETVADLREQKEVLLRSAGYPADYLEMHYGCPVCHDTGYVDNRKCRCFRAKEIEILYRQSNIRDVLERENFDTFRTDWFDDDRKDPRTGKTVREYMEMVRDMCVRYVEEFPRNKGNLLFTGKTGLGKTFLSNCIAKELIEQCFSVVYLSAAEMFDIFSKERFSREEEEDDRNRSEYLTECDLLIIDDLGTELVNTFTVSQLFYLINDRLIGKKGTIISTNLPTNQMRDEFTDRVMSRIVSGYQIIPLYGEDIRIRRKLISVGEAPHF